MNRKLLSMFMGLALSSIGCVADEPASDASTGTAGSTVEPVEPPLKQAQDSLLPSRELVAASWPDDLAAVQVFGGDTSVIVALNHDGDPIARIVGREIGADAQRIDVVFADGNSWSTLDQQNNALVEANAKGLEELEIAKRIELVTEHLLKAPDQEGPWLDCALAILDAAITCLPVVGALPLCPEKIKKAYCTCAAAAKKKKAKKHCQDND